jgi:hypothetical protein
MMSPARDDDLEARAASEVAFRLRQRGVRLTGDESADELVRLLEAVERFERVVERRGGDLMVDEPARPGRVQEPDDPRFVLPQRAGHETVGAYIDRVLDAAARASGPRRSA